jgi:hypothetical protein
MGLLLSALVLAAALEPYPHIGEAPDLLDDDLHLERQVQLAPFPVALGVSSGTLVGPGNLRGIAGILHASLQLQNGLAPDLQVGAVQWSGVAAGFEVMPGLRLGVPDGWLRPYLDFHLGTRLFPAQRGSAFDGLSAGIAASTGFDLMLTPHLGVGLHAAVNALFPTVTSWADLGGGITVRL